MTRRNIAFAAAALILGGLNLVNWLSGGADRSQSRVANAPVVNADDFRIRGAEPAPALSVATKRDLFQPKLAAVAKTPKKVAAAVPPAPPPKTPQELAADAARAELAQFKFVGVVFRGDRGQAFFVKGDQVFLAVVGDKIGDRFVLEKIDPHSAVLTDSATNVSGQLLVSGS